MATHRELVKLIEDIADLLRFKYKRSDNGKVMLPMTVLRRFDCVLEPTRAQVRERADGYEDPDRAAALLRHASGQPIYNVSAFNFRGLLADDETQNLASNLRTYIAGFDPVAREIIERFKFDDHIDFLQKNGLLYPLIGRFADIDLHPDRVDNAKMGTIFEDLSGSSQSSPTRPLVTTSLHAKSSS